MYEPTELRRRRIAWLERLHRAAAPRPALAAALQHLIGAARTQPPSWALVRLCVGLMPPAIAHAPPCRCSACQGSWTRRFPLACA